MVVDDIPEKPKFQEDTTRDLGQNVHPILYNSASMAIPIKNVPKPVSLEGYNLASSANQIMTGSGVNDFDYVQRRVRKTSMDIGNQVESTPRAQ